MKRFFTFLMVLALVFSAANAQDENVHLPLAGQQATPNIVAASLVNDFMPPFNAPSLVVYSTDFEGTTGANLPTGWVKNPTGSNLNGIWGGTANLNTTIAMPPHSGSRFAGIVTYAATAINAWMVSPAINLTAGNTYAVSFWMVIYGEDDGSDNDVLDVRIGNSNAITDLASATSLYYTATDVAYDWVLKTFYFTPTTSGSYYVGFHCTTPANTGWFIGIDDFAVSQARNNDLKVSGTYPYSQVPIEQSLLPTISANMQNIGSIAQTNVKLSLMLNETILQTSTPIATFAPGEVSNVNFNLGSTFFQFGNNALSFNVSSDQTDDDMSDNTATSNIKGTTTLYATDNGSMNTYYYGTATSSIGNVYTFSKPSTINQIQWYSYGVAGSATSYTLVIYEVSSSNTINNTTPIFSQTGTRVPATTQWYTIVPTTPINVSAGKYFVGIVGLNTELLADANAKGRNGYSTVYPPTSGSPLTPTTGHAPFVRLGVDFKNNDIQIVEAAFPYTRIPKYQAELLTFPQILSAKALNTGLTNQSNITFSATYNGTNLGTTTPIASLAVGTTSAAMSITPSASTVFPTELGTNSVEYKITQAETDQNPTDNSIVRNFEITNKIYSLDYLGNDPSIYQGIGSTTAGIKVGNIFTISKTATLTQVQVAFSPNPSLAAVNFNVVLQKITPPITGTTATTDGVELFVSQAVPRTAGGWVTVDLATPYELLPGAYYLAVKQSTTDNIGIAFDEVLGGSYCYYASTSASTTITQQTTRGAAGIRMVFDYFGPDSTTPENGAINVAPDAPVSVTFNKSITAGDLTGITISPTVSGVSASVSGSVLTIAHGNFANNTLYTVTVPSGAINGYNQAITWSFTTVSEAIEVVSTNPANNATNIAVDATVSVTFNKSVTAGDLTGITFNPSVSGVSASVNGAVLTIAHGNFANNTLYTVTIPANTITGYADPITWSFTTITASGTEVVKGNEINIFQNNGGINVIVSENSYIRVLDIFGRVLGNYNVGANSTLTFTQPAGFYIIDIQSNSGIYTYKVVVK